MKRALTVVLVAALAAGCSTAEPDAGHEAVLVKKPIIFGSGGVSPTPVKTGLTYIASTTTAVIVDVRPQQFILEINDLMSKDGVPLDFSAAIRVQVNDSVTLVEKFGAEGWYETNLKQPFFEAIRDAVKRRGMNEMAIDASAADAVDEEVTKAMAAVIKSSGLPLNLLDVNLGRANPPDSIKNQRTETAAQEQRANTERQRKAAEDARLAAEQARANADKAYLNQMGLTTEQHVELERIRMLMEVCAGGKCPYMGMSGTPLLAVK